jgi:AcrR family transcriptional regulator
MTAGAARAPGRPRSAEADLAIVRAALDVLVTEGYRGLTMEKVRERSGVGKATLYRRHGSKEELVRAVVEHLHQGLPVPDDTGSLEGDFAAVARTAFANAGGSTRFATLMPRLLAEVAHIPELREIFYAALVKPRRDTLEAVLRRAIARGEIRPDTDVELAIDVLAGPMIYKLIITGGDLEQVATMPARVVGLALDGLRPR